ncbi:MAG: phosphoenolpyruvate carboxylase [Cloacibacterium normanense]
MAFNEKDYQKISTDCTFIIDCYTEMLSRINEKELVDLINNTEGKKFGENELSSEKIIQSLSIYFQLMTLVEENGATQYRRRLEDQEKITAIRGSWGRSIPFWKNSNVTEEDMLNAVSATHVIPVLTAHPTEAKRVTVIELHRELYLLGEKGEYF